jgi:hypothetical protein
MTQHHTPLTFLSRATRRTEPSVSPAVNLLPRDTFADDPETLELYDQFTNLRQAIADNDRIAGRSKIAAEEARVAFSRGIREAIEAGKDPSEVKNDSDRLEAIAQAHSAISDQARSGLMRLSKPLAERIAAVAPEVIPASEKRLETAANSMRRALGVLSNAWGDYSAAWSERRILGNSMLNGGALGNYDGTGSFPENVRDALQVLSDHLADLDRLKSDETEIVAWRAKNAQP